MKCEYTVRKIVEEECDDYFLGIVDLSHANSDLIKQYESLVDEYPRAISIGITLRYTNQNAEVCKTNQQLNTIAANLCNLLEQKGYNALPMPKAKTIDDETFISLHVIAANLANLGRIEKNLLVTPEVGSGVNWSTVLTDAPLEG